LRFRSAVARRIRLSAARQASEHASRFLAGKGPPQAAHRRSAEPITPERSGSGLARDGDFSEVME